MSDLHDMLGRPETEAFWKQEAESYLAQRDAACLNMAIAMNKTGVVLTALRSLLHNNFDVNGEDADNEDVIRAVQAIEAVTK